ncbi:MAG: hypothetical protein A2144_03205 [Chloroflexi bacterium RBG_16_50_9]|nr:MAG: hypothetical protein A2144_03205 [Chloroflexi bacterium RBG_16_50_9]
MKNHVVEIMAAVLLCLAVLVLVQQQITTDDVWFNWHQIKNHESLAISLAVAAAALLVGKCLGKS